MGVREYALSFSVAVLQGQSLVLFISGEPLPQGTNVVVSHSGALDQGEMAMVVTDVLTMAVGALLNPDSFVTKGVHYDGEGNVKEQSTAEDELPF